MCAATRSSFSNPHKQFTMLLDASRTRAFADALRRTVDRDSVVADIGAGSGILALIAAQAGARHVYAVERTPLARLILPMASDNGLADQITVLHKDALELEREDFAHAPNVIVSETLGHFVTEEHAHQLFARLRGLFPQSLLIPQRYRLMVTPLWSTYFGQLNQLEAVEGIDLSRLTRQALSIPTVQYACESERAGATQPTAWNELASPIPKAFSADFHADRRFNALAITWEAELIDGVRLATSLEAGHSHWLPTLFFTGPCDNVGAPCSFELATRGLPNPTAWQWTLRTGPMVQTFDAPAQLTPGTVRELLDALGLELATPLGPPLAPDGTAIEP